MGIDIAIRKELIALARRADARKVDWSPTSPTVWQPSTVRNPNGILDQYFTTSSAWEFIAEQLEAGCEVTTVELRKPLGKKAYVLKIKVDANTPMIYVKVQLGSGTILGRSFHYSNRNKNTGEESE